MKVRHTEKEYLLDHSGVDAVSADIGEWLDSSGTDRKMSIRLRLSMEELLLRVSDHYDGKITGTLSTRRLGGVPVMRFRYRGESFNPIHSEEEEEDQFTLKLLSLIGTEPEWAYRSGVNEIVLRRPSQSRRSELRLLAAVILAILFGVLGMVLPEPVKTGLSDFLLDPVAAAFLNALNTFVGIMIFFMVTIGVCSMGSVSNFRKTGEYVVYRMLSRTFGGAAIAAVILIPFFDFHIGAEAGGASQAEEVLNMIYSIVPSNPVTPFAEGNILQIVFMAVIIGICIAFLSDRLPLIRDMLLELDILLRMIVNLVCSLLPVYIFTSLAVLFWKSGAAVFLQLWKPILLCLAVCLLFLLGKAVVTGIRLGVPVSLLLRKIRKPVLMGMITSSTAAVMGTMMDVNEKELGIPPKFSRFGLPVANIMCDSCTAAAFILIVYYLAEYYETAVNPGWFLIAGLMCAIFSMTTPPVAGGMLICMSLILTELGIPLAGLAAAGILGIILDIFATGCRIGIAHLELAQEADHLGMLDRDVLKAG